MFWKYLFSGLFVQKSMLPLQNQDFVPETVDSWSLCFTRHCTNTTGIASVSTCTWTCSLFQFVWDLVETCTKYDTGLGGLDHPANVLWFLESNSESSDGLTHVSNQRRSSWRTSELWIRRVEKEWKHSKVSFPSLVLRQEEAQLLQAENNFFHRSSKNFKSRRKFCAGVWTSWFLNCEEKRKNRKASAKESISILTGRVPNLFGIL